MSTREATRAVETEGALDAEAIRARDSRIIHPWQNLQTIDRSGNHALTRAEGIYVYDLEGKRYIDAPAGMWCINVGYGRREIADAVARQLVEMPYDSPWSFSNVPAADLAERLVALAPGDLKHVFYTTGGSTAVETALRFVMFYNNIRGRPEK